MLQKGFCTFKSKLKVNKTHLCGLKMRKIKLCGDRERQILDQVLILSLFLGTFKSPSPSIRLWEVVFLLPLAAHVIHSPHEGLLDLCKNELRSCCTLLWVSIVFHGLLPFLWARLYNIFLGITSLISFLTIIKIACSNPNILNLSVSITL